MVTNLSASVVNILYNFQLMKLAGENGIAAYGIIMYVNFIFLAVFMGYSIGSAPLPAYHYGAGNLNELKNLFRKGFVIMGASPPFVVMGINVWGSSFFTSLGDGAVSAAISFLRTFLFQIITVLLLPCFWHLDGIWLAIVIAELFAFVVTITFFAAKRNRYHYV